MFAVPIWKLVEKSVEDTEKSVTFHTPATGDGPKSPAVKVVVKMPVFMLRLACGGSRAFHNVVVGPPPPP